MSITMDGRTIRVLKPDAPTFKVVKPAPSRTVIVVARGPVGPPGSSAATYRHTQGAPAATWTIQHNLGRHPAAAVVLDGIGYVQTDLTYLDDNNLTIVFPAPVTGTADM